MTMETPEQAIQRLTAERDALSEQVSTLRGALGGSQAASVDAERERSIGAREALERFKQAFRQRGRQDDMAVFTVANELSEEYRRAGQRAAE